MSILGSLHSRSCFPPPFDPFCVPAPVPSDTAPSLSTSAPSDTLSGSRSSLHTNTETSLCVTLVGFLFLCNYAASFLRPVTARSRWLPPPFLLSVLVSPSLLLRGRETQYTFFVDTAGPRPVGRPVQIQDPSVSGGVFSRKGAISLKCSTKTARGRKHGL